MPAVSFNALIRKSDWWFGGDVCRRSIYQLICLFKYGKRNCYSEVFHVHTAAYTKWWLLITWCLYWCHFRWLLNFIFCHHKRQIYIKVLALRWTDASVLFTLISCWFSKKQDWSVIGIARGRHGDRYSQSLGFISSRLLLLTARSQAARVSVSRETVEPYA